MSHAYYLSNVLDPSVLEIVTRKALRYLRRVKADAIVVTGVSGMLLGGAISLKGQLPCIVVRKTTKNCHSGYRTEVPYGITSDSKIIFVDDLVSSGTTLKRVVTRLKAESLTISDHILNYKMEEDSVIVLGVKYTIVDINPD